MKSDSDRPLKRRRRRQRRRDTSSDEHNESDTGDESSPERRSNWIDSECPANPELHSSGLLWETRMELTSKTLRGVKLIRAVESLDIERVRRVLNQQTESLFQTSKGPWYGTGGWQAVHWAAYLGEANILELLSVAGASLDVHCTRGYLYAPIHAAANQDKAEAIAKLIELGAFVDERTNRNNTALHVAAEMGHVKAIIALLEGGASPNLQNENGDTALHLAAYHGNEAAVEELMKAGTALDVQNRNGSTALHRARNHCSRHYVYNNGKDNSSEVEMVQTRIITMLQSRPDLRTYEELLGLRENELIDSAELNLEDVIGEGFFGTVRKAYWRGMKVAVKHFKIHTVGGDEEQYKEEIRHEAKVLSRVCNHSCVVQFVGICLSPTPAVITRYMPRGSVDNFLVKNQEAVDHMLVIRMALEAALGVHHLHQEEVIHRDLAARNILVDDHFHVRVTDFGLARVKQACSIEFYTHSNIFPIKWAAPESFAKKKYSQRSDVFSFGVVLYEMFVRRSPWFGYANEEVQVMVLERALRMPLPENLDSKIKDLIERCWAQNPEERPELPNIISFFSEYSKSNDRGAVENEKNEATLNSLNLEGSCQYADWDDDGIQHASEQTVPVPETSVDSIHLENKHVSESFLTNLILKTQRLSKAWWKWASLKIGFKQL